MVASAQRQRLLTADNDEQNNDKHNDNVHNDNANDDDEDDDELPQATEAPDCQCCLSRSFELVKRSYRQDPREMPARRKFYTILTVISAIYI